METVAQACTRLVTALEQLVAQEAACLETRDFASVVELQKRAAPLVEHLTAHAQEITDEKLRARIQAIINRRVESGSWLAAEIERTREKLHALDATHRRANQVSAYGRTGVPARRQFTAVG